MESKFKIAGFTIFSLFLALSFNVSGQSLSVTLTSTNVTCFGSRDGSITANVSGGTPPYSYSWSNTEQTQTISNLAGGYYNVTVIDANNNGLDLEITLEEPERLNTSIFTPLYPNGFHVTCRFCNDGRINTSIDGGVPPYSYFYSDGAVAANRSDMLAGNFQLLITDANGCSNSHTFGLSAPDRDDWQITGNSGSNPSSHFIGTLDNKDLVFKSFANERLRIKSNGDLILNNFIGQAGMLSVDNNGILRTSNLNPALACTAPPPGWLNFNNLFILVQIGW